MPWPSFYPSSPPSLYIPDTNMFAGTHIDIKIKLNEKKYKEIEREQASSNSICSRLDQQEKKRRAKAKLRKAG